MITQMVATATTVTVVEFFLIGGLKIIDYKIEIKIIYYSGTIVEPTGFPHDPWFIIEELDRLPLR